MAYKAGFDEIRTFGVEIEVFGVARRLIQTTLRTHRIECQDIGDTRDVLSTWRLGTDGSIAGEQGVEVISPPLCGQEGLDELAKIMDILDVLGCQVNVSCGFHVHWNCGDFTGKNVLSLLRLYAKFEPVIDYLVSPSRRRNANEHCISLIKDDSLAWINQLDPSERKRASEIAILFERTHAVWRHSYLTHRSSRYHKVNIAAYNLYNTVEFRQHQGTVSAEKAVNWVVFTQQLVNKAKHVAVSRKPSAKTTLGELLRSLKIVDHNFVENEDNDQRVMDLAKWMKKRYSEFKEQERVGVVLETAVVNPGE